MREQVRAPRVSRTLPTRAAIGYCPTMPLRPNEQPGFRRLVLNVRKSDGGKLRLCEVVMFHEGWREEREAVETSCP